MNNQKYDELIKQTLATGGWDAAVDFINDCIEKDPNSIEAYLVRGEIYLEMEEFQEALADFDKVISIDPNIATVYFDRGVLYAKSDDKYKALDDFNQAIKLDANYTGAYANRANIFLKLEKLQQAIDDCNKAIEISPDEVLPYYNRGIAYMNTGEIAKALNDYNKVVELEPENAEAYTRRGSANQELGNIQEAIADYEKALEIDSDCANAELIRDALKELKSGTTPSDDENYEVKQLKKEMKILLICSAVGFILGTIIGAGSENVFAGMWFGIGIGGALNFIPEIPGIFMRGFRSEGCVEALKTTFVGGLIWVVIFMVAGPIGLLVRVIKKNIAIKNAR